MIIFVHFYFPFSVHCYIIIYNLKIISILDDRYAEHFGFTDDEVIKICEDYNIQQKYETIKQWFN